MQAAVSALQGFSQRGPAGGGTLVVVVVLVVVDEVLVGPGSDVLVPPPASHTSPMQSPSASRWSALGTATQLSSWSGMPSPS